MRYSIIFATALATSSNLVVASPVAALSSAVVSVVDDALCTYDGCANITPFCSSYLSISTVTTTDTTCETDTETATVPLPDTTITITADLATETDSV